MGRWARCQARKSAPLQCLSLLHASVNPSLLEALKAPQCLDGRRAREGKGAGS